jgi:hypothetical protein
MMLKSMAVQKELTLKSNIKWSQSIIMIVLITNRNKPNVKKVMGKVKITNTGFTKKLSIANTTATFNEVSIPLTRLIPFIK